MAIELNEGSRIAAPVIRQQRLAEVAYLAIVRPEQQGLLLIRSHPEGLAFAGSVHPSSLSKPPDVVSQGGDPLSDRPDAIEPQGIDGQAAEGGQDLDAVVLPVAVSVFPQRHIPHPVPAVLD